MPGRRRHEKHENGRSFPDGKARNGVDQAVTKYIGYSERSLSRTRKGTWIAISYA